MPEFSEQAKALWELASYMVTVVGLPFAILVFLHEQRKERDHEDEAAYQSLSDAYKDFLKVVLDNADLQLRSGDGHEARSAEQQERVLVIYEMLVSLFERAYIVAYEPKMNPEQARRWNSWSDFMREWCRREDFRRALPTLLRGEDPEFISYIERIAQEEASRTAVAPASDIASPAPAATGAVATGAAATGAAAAGTVATGAVATTTVTARVGAATDEARIYCRPEE